MFRRPLACILLMTTLVLWTPAASARGREIDKSKMLRYNVAFTGVFTLVSALAQGEVTSARDALHHFLIGAGAGVSFYQAKRIAGAGRTTEGWVLANMTSTVIENTASGEHPLGRVGYTVGPFRLRVATPYARTAVARIEADWSLAETVALGLAVSEGDRVRFRDGLIAIDRNSGWPNPDRNDDPFEGRTFGVFPGVSPGATDITWNHEVIHAVQFQQVDSVEPPVYTFAKSAEPTRPPRRLFVFRHVRAGFVQGLHGATTEWPWHRPYHERWVEVEAYGLAERVPVR